MHAVKQRNFDVRAADQDGMTALHYACALGMPLLAEEHTLGHFDLVQHSKITGIVDMDEICFGDSLFVIALTSTCLELESLDTKYTDYWEAALHLDKLAQARLDFYRLFYAIAFMRKHTMHTANNKKVMFDTEKLKCIFNQSLDWIVKYGF